MFADPLICWLVAFFGSHKLGIVSEKSQKFRLNMDSGELREQHFHERTQQGFSSSSDIVDELKESQV